MQVPIDNHAPYRSVDLKLGENYLVEVIRDFIVKNLKKDLKAKIVDYFFQNVLTGKIDSV